MKKKLILTMIIAILVIVIGFAYFFLADVFFSGNRNPNVGPPNSSPEIRHQWGKKHLKIWYEKTIEWVNSSEIIKNDVGSIKNVTPLGIPNYFSCSFTEGCQADLTLEVAGEKRTGFFNVWGVGIDTTSHKYHFSGSRWKFGEKEIQIHQSDVPCSEYYKPENIVAVYTKEISESRNDDKKKMNLLQSLVSRSIAFSKINRFEEAIGDAEEVLDLYVIIHKDWHDAINEKEQKNEIKRFLSYLYYSSRQYDNAEKLIEDIFGDMDYANLAVDDFEMSSRDYQLDSLWLWIVQSKNKNSQADENFKNRIILARAKSEEAKKNNQSYTVDSCFEKSTDYLLRNIDENEFLKKGSCFVYKNYYVGQKKLLGGDKAAALSSFRKFIEDDYWKRSEDKCMDEYAYSNYYSSFDIEYEIARRFVETSSE